MKKQFTKIMLAMVVGLIISGTVSVTAQTFTVDVGTGGDDLRGGNTAFMSLVLTTGEVTTEQVLSRGAGGNSNSTGNRLTFPSEISASQIRSIRIRHDGNPRSGHPFDTYDNWNLRSLRVVLDGNLIYNSIRDTRFRRTETRFTGALRQIDLPIRAIGSEPDFVITNLRPGSRGLSVTVSNIGLGEGRIIGVRCSSFGRSVDSGVGRNLIQDRETVIPVGFALTGGTVTCSVTGADLSGTPETVTANNIFTTIPR